MNTTELSMNLNDLEKESLWIQVLRDLFNAIQPGMGDRGDMTVGASGRMFSTITRAGEWGGDYPIGGSIIIYALQKQGTTEIRLYHDGTTLGKAEAPDPQKAWDLAYAQVVPEKPKQKYDLQGLNTLIKQTLNETILPFLVAERFRLTEAIADDSKNELYGEGDLSVFVMLAARKKAYRELSEVLDAIVSGEKDLGLLREFAKSQRLFLFQRLGMGLTSEKSNPRYRALGEILYHIETHGDL